MDNSFNLTRYINKDSHLSMPLNKFRVYKKADPNKNKYYWQVKSNDMKFFYTNTDNVRETLGNILRMTRISTMRGKLIDKYFEYLLISHICGEDVSVLHKLSAGRECEINGVYIKTQDSFELKRMEQQSEIDSAKSQFKTPDLWLKYNNDTFIIDAYNGSNMKEVQRKIRSHRDYFKNAKVYLFVSGVSALEQVVSKAGVQFRIYTLNGNKEVEVEEIKVGPLVVSVHDLNSIYREQYLIYKTEIFYWQHCEIHDTIIQTPESNKL